VHDLAVSAVEHLARATRALDNGALDEALTELVEGWRTCRHERIANLVDAVSERVTPGRPRPGGTKIEDKQKRWYAMADKNDPANIGPLLATLVDIKKSEPLRDRITTLSRLPADPRVAAALVTLVLEQLPVPGATGISPVRVALRTIVSIGDRRQLPALQRLIGLETPVGKARHFVTEQAPRFIVEFERTAPAELDVALLAVVEDLEACLVETQPAGGARADAEALFAAVYANPDDDTPRVVLADYLQQCGDPRGEFIALQLARAAGGPRSKRESELLRASGRDLLGPIEPMVLKSNLVYERGFLSRCGIKCDSLVVDPLAQRPEWATVTDVDIGNIRARDDDEFLARMPVLRVIRGIWGVPAPRPRLEELYMDHFEGRAVPALTLESFPALRRLGIDRAWATIDELDPLWSSSLGQQLVSVSIAFSRYDHGDVMRLLELPIENIVATEGRWRFELTGAKLAVTYWPPYSRAGTETFDALAASLGRLSMRRIRDIVVDAGDVPLPPTIVEAVARFAQPTHSSSRA
jgi:uncharacterized protein (TIGR02996 family)